MIGSATTVVVVTGGTTVTNPNQAPFVDPGTYNSIGLPNNSLTLKGTVTDDGLPNNTLIISCPKEHQQHLELAAFYPKIAVGYTQIATISTDDHHTLQEFRASRETRSQGRHSRQSRPAQIFSLQPEIQAFTQYSDPNFLTPPFPVLVSSTGRAWQWQTSSPL
jgi:hypothetical protein